MPIDGCFAYSKRDKEKREQRIYKRHRKKNFINDSVHYNGRIHKNRNKSKSTKLNLRLLAHSHSRFDDLTKGKKLIKISQSHINLRCRWQCLCQTITRCISNTPNQTQQTRKKYHTNNINKCLQNLKNRMIFTASIHAFSRISEYNQQLITFNSLLCICLAKSMKVLTS